MNGMPHKAVEVKICGLTNLEDARFALEAGADFLGFVLYEKSVRSIEPAALKRITKALGPDARCVGVFVNASCDVVRNVAGECGLYAVQLHGDERPEAFRKLPTIVWRAVRLADGRCRPRPADWPAERYVLDADVPGAYGGTGVTLNPSWAADVAAAWPVMLAGGLNPGNVAGAVRKVRPLGVDVSSGVEKSAGRKDRAKVQSFIRYAKERA